MFYLPIKLRTSKKLIEPRGPSFSSAKIYELFFDNAKLIFKAPKDGQKISKRGFIYRGKNYPHGNPFIDANASPFSPKELINKWQHAKYYQSGWSFNGPWFTGTVSDLKLSLITYRIKNYPESVSLLHPRAFEKVIGDYLTCFYSEVSDHKGNIQTYTAPIDWRSVSAGDVDGAHFKIARTLTNNLGGGDRFLAFIPLDKRTMACFIFDTARLGLIPETSHNKISSLEPLYELMNNIIDSIKVELSSEAKRQKQLAQEGLEDPSLVKDFPPIKWDKLDDQTRARILEQDERDRIAEFGC